MAVVKFRRGLKIDLNVVTLVLVSCMLFISLVLTAVLAARSPSNLQLRSVLGQCKTDKEVCGRRVCRDSNWKRKDFCPSNLDGLRQRGYDPKYNVKYLTANFPTDQSSVALGFTAFALLSLCLAVQGLAHSADYLLPDPHTVRPKNRKQKLFVYGWLGLAWVLLLLTWILVLAGSVQAQKDWGLYNVERGTFVAAAVFCSIVLVMLGAYNLISMHKGPSLDAGSEPLTPTGAAKKANKDSPWKSNQGDSKYSNSSGSNKNKTYAPDDGLLEEGRSSSSDPFSPLMAPSAASSQLATPAQINVHVAPTFNNFPPPPPGGYVSAPAAGMAGAEFLRSNMGGDDDRSVVSEPGVGMVTKAMDKLRPGQGDGPPGFSSEILMPARPPPPPPKSPPRVSVAIKAGQVAALTFEELSKATDNFAEDHVLGEGGFGSVYYGTLHSDDGLHEVAVKRLHPSVTKGGSKGSQGAREFQAEVEIISRVHHRNLVKLLGYCLTSDEYLLAYEFMPNGSLYERLHRRKEGEFLDWKTRRKIALGSAKGLTYLHEDCSPKVIHRDIKASNILLDAQFNAQVADFGLARLIKEENSHITTRVMGTFGYLAPDYAFSGQLTDKSDVYSFGVVLLELLTGKKPVDPSAPPGQQSLVQWAWQMDGKSLADIVDPTLGGRFSAPEAARMWSTALKCINQSPQLRPRMDKVLSMLTEREHDGDEEEEEEEEEVDEHARLAGPEEKKPSYGRHRSSAKTATAPAADMTSEVLTSSSPSDLAPIREDGLPTEDDEPEEETKSMSTMFAGILSQAARDSRSEDIAGSGGSFPREHERQLHGNADDDDSDDRDSSEGEDEDAQEQEVMEVSAGSASKRSVSGRALAVGADADDDKSVFGSNRSIASMARSISGSGMVSPKGSLSPAPRSGGGNSPYDSGNRDSIKTLHIDQASLPDLMNLSNVEESIVLPERFVKPR